MISKKSILTLVITSVSALLVLLLFNNSGVAVAPKKSPAPSDYHTGISWEEAQEIDKPIIVNFYVDWCSACRRFAPIFEGYRKEFGSDFSFVIVKTDAPGNGRLSREFNIYQYPTVFLVDKKNERKIRLDSYKYYDKESFKAELDAFLAQQEN